MSTRARVLLFSFVGAFLLVLVAWLALAPTVVSRFVRARASRAGLELSFARASVGLTEVRLEGARFSLVGAPQIAGTAETLTVSLLGLSLRKIEGRTVEIAATGTASELGRAVGGWAKAFPESSRLDSAFRNVTLRVAPRAGAAPLLLATGASVSALSGVWTVRASRFDLYGASFGALDLELVPGPAGTLIAIGGTRQTAPVLAVLDPRGAAPVIDVELRPTALSPTPSGGRPFTASGTAKVSFLDDGTAPGTFRATLLGFSPPGPREIASLLGASTQISGRFVALPSTAHVDLSDVQIVAGALALRGKGSAEVPGAYATVDLSLAGSVPCAAVGAAVVKSTMGGAIGNLLGGVVAGTIKGDVPVTAVVRADTRSLANAQVATTADVRCGLGF